MGEAEESAMKNVLVLVHDDPGQEARLRVSIDVVRAIGGHLSCLGVVDAPPPIGYPSPELGAVMVREKAGFDTVDRDQLGELLRIADVPWSFDEGKGSIESCLRSAAGLADLMILSSTLDG